MPSDDCRCKICRHNLRAQAEQWRQTGQSNDDIRSLLAARGIKVTPRLIQRHFKVLDELAALASSSDEQEAPSESLMPSQAPVEPAQQPITPIPAQATLSEPLYSPERLNGLDLSGYDFDASDPASILAYMQQRQIALYLRQMQIVAHEQEEFLEGRTKIPPTRSIKSLKTLLEMTNRITGISMYANQQAAVNTVRRMGIRASEFIDVQEKES